MIVKTLTVGALGTNCYVIGEHVGGVGAIIDPGAEAARILDVARLFTIRYVIDTHAHFDHIMANAATLQGLRETQEAPVELVAHAQAAPLLAAGGGASLFGFAPVSSPAPDRLVDAGDALSLGSAVLHVLHTPGHSPGSISLHCQEAGIVFVGDVLFQRGVGRSDLPGGSWSALQASIRQQLFALPDSTVVYPGHGPATTIGAERRGNPFLTS
ncbi:MAG: MBL fold metallo-hydrolase [Anaerolineae bacterium]|nr:MBL fold metallo-hydrolase [Anaerolineae bacterium]